MDRPTFRMVLEARNAILPYLPPTPLVSYPALNDLLDCEVFVKREDCQPISAFKVRGGINLVSRLDAAERGRGLITASTGNHGQSIAYACRIFGARSVVCVPEGANPLKVKAMEALGAQVHAHGAMLEDARELAEEQSREHGLYYVHPPTSRGSSRGWPQRPWRSWRRRRTWTCSSSPWAAAAPRPGRASWRRP